MPNPYFSSNNNANTVNPANQTANQTLCNECGVLTNNDDMYSVSDAQTRMNVCLGCLDDGRDNGDFFRCEACQNFFSDDIRTCIDDENGDTHDYCRSCYSNRSPQRARVDVIELDFEKQTSETFTKNPYEDFCGIELEVMNDNLQKKQFSSSSSEERNAMGKFGFSQKRDGSLKEGFGVEYVSNAWNGDLLLQKIKDFCEELTKREFYVTAKCGYHLHIGVRPNLALMKKILLFYDTYEDYFFDMVSDSRRNNIYCSRLGVNLRNANIGNTSIPVQTTMKDVVKNIDLYNSMSDFRKLFYEIDSIYTSRQLSKQHYYKKRYYWLNFHSLFFRGTIENRLFGGTIDTKKITSWLMFNLEAINYLKEKSVDDIKLMKKDKKQFLSCFTPHTQSFITERWKRFEKGKGKEDDIREELVAVPVEQTRPINLNRGQGSNWVDEAMREMIRDREGEVNVSNTIR